MADESTDVLMRIVNKGSALAAGSGTEFAASKVIDTLRAGFEPGQFCELSHFHLSAGVEQTGQARGGPDVIDIRPVEFVRMLDTASTLLFQAMATCDTLDSISIIKRKSGGSDSSGEVYLRLDFEKVLITNLVWRDTGKIIEESGHFIYRELKIRYRPQNNDGSLGTVIPSAWKMKN